MKSPFGCCLLTILAAWAIPASAQEAEPAGDPIYDRPFITTSRSGSTAIGGYVEGNTNYFSEDGVTDGFSVELRRFNLFVYSSIGSRIAFLSELEFEHGTEEINLETALIDFELHPSLIVRGGILLPPVGLFNQNHDSPKWEFVDRPIVSTHLIPSTLSEAGFGVHGGYTFGAARLGYQAYLVNGLGEGVVSNAEGRTFIPSGKHTGMLAEDNNGTPAFTARIGVERFGLGEIGVSLYRGIYNTYRIEGEEVADKERLSLAVFDAQVDVLGVSVQGELAYAHIGVPSGLADVFGDRQRGGFVEAVAPVYRPAMWGPAETTLNLNARYEWIDYHTGTFSSTGRTAYDDVRAIVLGISFRPASEAVFKANYRYHWIRDLLGNPARLGGFQVGFATYF
jgi:hypothetical protein